MLVDALCTMYRYTDWANERILNAAANLTPEQFTASDDTPLGSIRNTLVHMLVWQRRWLRWWSSRASTSDEAMRFTLDPDDFPDVESIRAEWQDLHARTELFLAELSDARLSEGFSSASRDGRPWTMPLWQLMVQVANHGTQHRSEIAMKLTNHGHSPGNLDYYFYVLDAGAARVP